MPSSAPEAQASDFVAVSRKIDIAWALAIVTFSFHAIANPHYGFFRDELYFIICGRHPDFGYVDQPPLVPLLAAASQAFGISLLSLRLFAAFFSAATVWVACRTARELDGGAFAQVLAGIVVLLGTASATLDTEAPGVWLWPLIGLLVLRLCKGAPPKLWLWIGVAIGICLNTKYSVVFFVLSLITGLMLTPQRRIVRNWWFVGGAAIAVAFALPNFLWQAAHGFPMLELLRNGAAGKNVVLSPVEFLWREIQLDNPILAVVWVCGLIYSFLRADLRWLGWTYVVLIALMIALHAKDYYPEAIYPLLFAAGAAAIEAWTARARTARVAIAGASILAGLWTLPLWVPMLPVPIFVAYARAMHLASAPEETKAAGVLPQQYADMHGWPELAREVASAYASIPPADRSRAAVFATNYGEAAAIDFFGPQYGLPPAISGHNQYYIWGTRGFDGSVSIVLNVNPVKLKGLKISRVATFSNPLGMPYEDHMPITVCGGYPWITRNWSKLKHFD